jgi:hypothetical protein
MKTDSFDSFFSIVSKAVIIIPIVIIILSLIFRFNQNTKTTPSFIPSPTPTNIITPTVINKIPLDLNGPWVCHYKNNNQEYSLFIKNKKVLLEVKENNQSKKYDLSSYVPLAENLLKMDLQSLGNFAKPYLPKGVDLKSILSSCKKEEFEMIK